MYKALANRDLQYIALFIEKRYPVQAPHPQPRLRRRMRQADTDIEWKLILEKEKSTGTNNLLDKPYNLTGEKKINRQYLQSRRTGKQMSMLQMIKQEY
jgi:hypothetical protein